MLNFDTLTINALFDIWTFSTLIHHWLGIGCSFWLKFYNGLKDT